MKNAILMLLVAGLLFAVSAGMSLWLNQPKPGEDDAAPPKSTKRKSTTGEKEEEKSHTSPRNANSNTGASHESESPMSSGIDRERSRIAEREAEIEHQREVHRFLLEDIRDEMDYLQKLRHRSVGEQPRSIVLPVAPESPKPNVVEPRTGTDSGKSPISSRPSTVTPPTLAPNESPIAGRPKKPSDPIDPKNLQKLVQTWELMPPEVAAQAIEKMIQTGSTDTVIQVLARMNARQLAKILALIPELLPMIIEKIRDFKPPETKLESPPMKP